LDFTEQVTAMPRFLSESGLLNLIPPSLTEAFCRVYSRRTNRRSFMDRMTRRSFFGTVGIAAATPAFGAIAGQKQNWNSARGTVSVEKDVVFGKGGGMDLRCDIYRPPAGTEKRMATIHFHGGGFARGNKDGLSERVQPLASRGYVAIAAQYRLSGQARWPAQIEDAKAVIRWTRANAARLGIQPDRIAVVGYSAGGHLALFTAGTPNRPEFEGSGGNAGVSTKVAACLAYYPSTGVRPRADGTANALMPPGSNAAAHLAASPTSYVTAAFPPTVIFHGLEDVTIPVESSQRLFQQLRDAKVPVELHTFDGVPHAFDGHPEFADPCGEIANLFLDHLVLNPRKYPPFNGGGDGTAR
jgi:acetyl esterase/lipase